MLAHRSGLINVGHPALAAAGDGHGHQRRQGLAEEQGARGTSNDVDGAMESQRH